MNLQAFWNNVEVTKSCWNWLGAKSDGYGRVRVNGDIDGAHRITYKILVGNIPKNLDIDHLCRNRACVNPEHMQLTTRRENILRGVGLAAENIKKTHCKRGHELSGENLYTNPNGKRTCRTCYRMKHLGWHKRVKGN